MQAHDTMKKLLKRWQRHIGRHFRSCRRGHRVCRLAGVTFLCNVPAPEELVAVEHLLLLVLYEETLPSQYRAVRLAGFGASRIAEGVL